MRGMFVRVTFHTPIQTQLLGIPEKAVQPGNIVYKIDNGKLKIIPVKRVRTFPGQVILDGNASALKAGDRVITSPLSVVKEDMAVEERAN